MYHLLLTATAKKNLRKLDKKYRSAVEKAFNRLQKNPRTGEPLKGELKGRWKLRFSHYRIIYRILDEILLVIIVEIGHRREVYR